MYNILIGKNQKATWKKKICFTLPPALRDPTSALWAVKNSSFYRSREKQTWPPTEFSEICNYHTWKKSFIINQCDPDVNYTYDDDFWSSQLTSKYFRHIMISPWNDFFLLNSFLVNTLRIASLEVNVWFRLPKLWPIFWEKIKYLDEILYFQLWRQ